jgi:hypothetical protein
VAILAGVFIVVEVQGRRASSGGGDQRVEDVVQRGSRQRLARRDAP